MTQEQKQLLLTEFCVRLPYGIAIYRITDNSIHRIQYSDITENIDQFSHFLEYSGIDNIKPYLRPLSSMTEEERTELSQLIDSRLNGVDWKPWSLYDKTGIKNGIGGEMLYLYDIDFIYDYLNVHHFDYRGLIEKGLALEATKGMYKTK